MCRNLGVIDAAYFPHIVDEIWAHLDLSSLLRVRVCKSWSEKADRKIAYHLVLRRTWELIEVLSGLLGERLLSVSVEDLEDTKLLRPSWARWARVIDIDTPYYSGHTCALLAAWGVDRYETLRFTKAVPPWEEYSVLHERPMRLVLFEPPDFNSDNDFNLENDSNSENDFCEGEPLLSEAEAVDVIKSERFMGAPLSKCVIHQTHTESSLDMEDLGIQIMQAMTSCHVVVVFHPWDESTTKWYEEDTFRAFWRNLGQTYMMMEDCLSRQDPERGITLVGLERMSPAHFGMDDEDVAEENEQRAEAGEGPFSLEDEIFDLLESDWRWFGGHGDAPLAIKTLEEYREEIGPTEFEIEMSLTITNLRSTWPYSDRNRRLYLEKNNATSD